LVGASGAEGKARREKDFVPTISAVPDLSMLRGRQRKQIEREILPGYIRNCRWFGAKARTVRDMRVAEEVPIGSEKTPPVSGSSK
jgi:maltose alpha-D-glucosyltransferase/alpha-amylase